VEVEIEYTCTKWGNREIREVSLLVSGRVEDVRGSGSVEDARQVAENAGDILSRLVNILANKGLLTPEEILEIADVYGSEPRFIPEPEEKT